MSARRGIGPLAGSLLLVLALASVGCARGCTTSRSPIHINPNMDWQEKAEAQEESGFFYDGRVMRPPVPGTVARGELHADGPRLTGRDAAGAWLGANPLGDDEALLARGAERYAIFCEPCHDRRGLGTGVLFEYGKIPTASLHDEQRLGYPDGQLYDIITNGSGLMKGYAYPIPPDDRWAIVAHVRQLQRERQQRLASLAGRD